MSGTPEPTPAIEADTLTDALTQLEAEGYVGDFRAHEGAVTCPVCGVSHDPATAIVEKVCRFEGASDPDDESIVLALRCPLCGALGVFVSGYGPTADPDTIDLVVALTDGR